MQKYDINRPCPKCENTDTKDVFDFYPTKQEREGILTKYETTKLIKRKCRECGHVWFEEPIREG